ncbi:hypothetical protein [Dyella silvatica]|uniref:hypothetical protein n=1 Tax=Dyella silvatica TaxID=2992128 RepID=UPI002251EAAD|nr:hypothetical protein [Dyella silvatica]
MKTPSNRLITTLMILLTTAYVDVAHASKTYTVVFENLSLQEATIVKKTSNCMINDGPASVTLEPRITSQEYTIEDKDTFGGSCWSADKTVTWGFSDPSNGGSFYFDHEKSGSWRTGFWPEQSGSMSETVWCGTKSNPKAAQCFGRWVSGDFDYFTISFTAADPSATEMRFEQSGDADPIYYSTQKVICMNKSGIASDTFTDKIEFPIENCAPVEGNESKIEWKMQAGGQGGPGISVAYYSKYAGGVWHTQIRQGSGDSGAPSVMDVSCDGKKCLAPDYYSGGTPKKMTVFFGAPLPRH